MWCAWRFSTGSNTAIAPSAPRAAIAETSAAKGTKVSRISGRGASRAKAGARSAASRSTAWPRPS